MTMPNPQREIILVVDDEPGICSLVKTLLELEGYAVLIANDAETASRIYEKRSAEVALLLTDIRMPHMNGLELADRVLRRNPKLRVLFMSGSDDAPRGFGCIAKPFTRAELIGGVSAALDRLSPPKVHVAAQAA